MIAEGDTNLGNAINNTRRGCNRIGAIKVGGRALSACSVLAPLDVVAWS
ncbi:hypothetical protein OSB_14910 [Octadecabacter temperatus]|uniref:Uncharacterized protein n=1 Tax=Octadecabacter temperatus TaxID=1458307 RepID=A0A0K0Y4X1_9RHOB|nr:hypothetical protein OSB_14910 [Octadecabacter temperatus]